MVGRFVKREDDAWCDDFIMTWNTQAYANKCLVETIEDLEERIDELLYELDRKDRKLARLAKSFNMLADRMREGL